MTKQDFAFNVRTSILLFIASVPAVFLHKSGYIDDDLYPQLILGSFFLFLLFRVLAPFAFTRLNHFGTLKMQENFRKHPLGVYFLIED